MDHLEDSRKFKKIFFLIKQLFSYLRDVATVCAENVPFGFHGGILPMGEVHKNNQNNPINSDWHLPTGRTSRGG